MQNRDASALLKEAISELEIRQAKEGELLKEQLFVVYDKLKPLNLIKSTFEEIVSSLGVKHSLINNLIGAVMGYLTQRVIVGSKPSLFKKLAGMLLEYGVAAVVSRYAGTLKTMGMQMITEFLSKKNAEDIDPAPSESV